ncbi:MAG: MFS transporter [Desulfobacteraceae bacterium]|nr:MAG: MFS transporter [Desulfobacteraceae bacterium]
MWYVNFSSRTIISPLLPIIEDEFAISHAVAGSIFSFLSVGYTITLLLSGVLSPRIGYKRSIALGFLLLMTSLFFLRYSTTYASFAAASLCIGLGAGIYLPSAIPLITAVFERKNWGKAIAFQETAASFSILSIPLLTALALRFLNWRALFFILSVLCLFVCAFFCIFSPDFRPQTEKRARFSRVLRRRSFRVMATLWVFIGSCGLGLYNVIPLFLVKENGMNLETANTIFGFSRIGGFIVAILVGFLVDRYGAKKILFLVVLATGLSTMSLALAQTIPFLVAMLFLQATIYPAFFPVALVAISKLTDLNERSIFTGTTVAIGVIVGLGLTPLILGAVADVWNFKVGIFSLGALTTFSCISLRGIRGM